MDIKETVKKEYSKIAEGVKKSCCGEGPVPGRGCGDISSRVGYTDDDISAVPDGANLGLGCGNPVALASIKEGETILDLGSGAGFDAFLAAKKTGRSGRVIGVDMTPAMVEKARKNAAKGGYSNVEFRLGEIENLPLEDNSIDCIISNCVINLSVDKPRVFKEAFRVLKKGGRLMVSDLVLAKPLPKKIQNSVKAYVGCLAGAMLEKDYVEAIKQVGFQDISIEGRDFYPMADMANDPIAGAVMYADEVTAEDIKEIGRSVVSIKIRALKS